MAGHADVAFEDLPSADLLVDRVYRGGTAGHAGDDALARLLPVGNQGGFRYKGSVKSGTVKLVVLYTSGAESNWPDSLDVHTGVFTYHGDNRSAGRELHDTQRQGNALLRQVFELTHGSAEDRAHVPPFFLFDKPGPTRDVRFRGLLAPGSDRFGDHEDLVAVWRVTRGVRFQNYRSTFTVLDVPKIARAWLDEIGAGNHLGEHCPKQWTDWVATRAYSPLLAPPTVIIRGRQEQLPAPADQVLLAAVHCHSQDYPYAFERFAADLWRAAEPHVDRLDLTRPWRDGGRDATGEYLIGPRTDPVAVEFALEAKCYGPTNGVGVREVSRLISRLRHRQFGVLITTSFVNEQAYREIREDGHPVVIVAGKDLVDMLRARGLDSPVALQAHLRSTYPLDGS